MLMQMTRYIHNLIPLESRHKIISYFGCVFVIRKLRFFYIRLLEFEYCLKNGKLINKI